MDLEEMKRKIHEEELRKANNNYFVLEPAEYANDIAELILECEGEKSVYQHFEVFQGVDVSNYLRMIKNIEKECAIILAITDRVEDKYIVYGEENCIHAESYFIDQNSDSSTAVEFINKWLLSGAKICNYHNHPFRIAAIPSDNDIESFCCKHTINRNEENEWDLCVSKYGIDIPSNFKYDDWGVVTPFDFFSYSQFVENGHEILELRMQNKTNSIRIQEVLGKYDAEY